MKLLRHLRWMLLLGLLFTPFAFAVPAPPMTEQQKIDALIHGIETLQGAQFVRNGSAYDGTAAADHLRMKLRNAGDRIRTANDFITNIASHSSMSGLPYKIRYAEGRTVDAEAYFRAELKRIETPAPAPVVVPVPAPIPTPVPARIAAATAIPVPASAVATHPSVHSAAERRHAHRRHSKLTAQKRPS